LLLISGWKKKEMDKNKIKNARVRSAEKGI
jgi:hypothetical protein